MLACLLARSCCCCLLATVASNCCCCCCCCRLSLRCGPLTTSPPHRRLRHLLPICVSLALRPPALPSAWRSGCSDRCASLSFFSSLCPCLCCCCCSKQNKGAWKKKDHEKKGRNKKETTTQNAHAHKKPNIPRARGGPKQAHKRAWARPSPPPYNHGMWTHTNAMDGLSSHLCPLLNTPAARQGTTPRHNDGPSIDSNCCELYYCSALLC